jgi:hypothetical protein
MFTLSPFLLFSSTSFALFLSLREEIESTISRVVKWRWRRRAIDVGCIITYLGNLRPRSSPRIGNEKCRDLFAKLQTCHVFFSIAGVRCRHSTSF